ncbi:MAG: hypothetical protein WAO35_13805 [Terriglobia bacterium]
MMRRSFSVWPLAVVLSVLPACVPGYGATGQDIRVHVVDPHNGLDVQGVRVWLYFGSPLRHPMPSDTPRLEGRTGPDGTVVFHLASPLPDQLFVYPPDRALVSGCSHGDFVTKQVLDVGVVGDAVCKVKKWKGISTIKARPGEIILFEWKLRWWEKLQD